MRAIIIGFLRVYFGIGLIFGLLLAISYPLGAISAASSISSFIGYFILFVSPIAFGLFGFVVRTFLWLPSLTSWYFFGPEPSFVFWLMPGLFITVGQAN